MEKVLKKREEIREIIGQLQDIRLEPPEINDFLNERSSAPVLQRISGSQILLRPGITLTDLISFVPRVRDQIGRYSKEALEQAEIQIKYEVYMKKEEELVAKMSALEDQVIPESFNYENISSLSNEARQKFKKIRPQTLGQASRISGVNPSDVQILMVYMGR
jgi:tRNA uridine 5-carboxymethylaminomethyl modification enzyme